MWPSGWLAALAMRLDRRVLGEVGFRDGTIRVGAPGADGLGLLLEDGFDDDRTDDGITPQAFPVGGGRIRQYGSDNR